MRAAWASLLLLPACGLTVRPDSRLLVDALRLPETEMAVACQEILDESMRAECLAQAGAALAATDRPAALAACAEAPAGLWRDECWFLVVDRAGLTGDEARQHCAQAGRFVERCNQHALIRELKDTDRPTEVGQERDLRHQISALVDLYHPSRSKQEREVITDAAMAQQLGRRWADAPFREEDCGTESRRVCAMAYEAHVWSALEDKGFDTLCAEGPPDLARVAELGALGWEGDTTIPAQVWMRTCRAAKGARGSKNSAVGPRR